MKAQCHVSCLNHLQLIINEVERAKSELKEIKPRFNYVRNSLGLDWAGKGKEVCDPYLEITWEDK